MVRSMNREGKKAKRKLCNFYFWGNFTGANLNTNHLVLTFSPQVLSATVLLRSNSVIGPPKYRNFWTQSSQPSISFYGFTGQDRTDRGSIKILVFLRMGFAIRFSASELVFFPLHV
jgi:hypothetical protein